MKFAATILIFYNFTIQKRIVSTETIRRNTVHKIDSYQIIFSKVFKIFFLEFATFTFVNIIQGKKLHLNFRIIFLIMIHYAC